MNLGPWNIAHLKNKHGKKKIVVHTNAQHFAFVLNVTEPDEEWQLIEWIGPIDVLKDAEKLASVENLNFKEAAQYFVYSYQKGEDLKY
jgi:hypothetical protein